MNTESRRAGVVGASGYTGQEVVALLRRHPGIELAFATSESEAGGSVPGGGRYIPAAEAPFDGVDVVFTCLPSGESGDWALRACAAGAAVVDLSADLRGGKGRAVYGLPELHRGDVSEARLVANPGCYPTGVLIALWPAMRRGLVDGTRPLIIDAASGVTGAGRSVKRDLLFGEVAEDYRAYGVGNRHRHVPEIGAGLQRLGSAPPFIFTPHLLPVRRGILATIYMPLREPLTAVDAVAEWSDAYAGEPFVEVWAEGLPSLRSVVGRNVAGLGFSEVEGMPSYLIVVVAIDNLLKGAAGQAVQNANLMLGLPEAEGLPR